MKLKWDRRAPRVGVALGGGGVRGLAHVGVLRVLVEERVPLDLLAGISMGAAVAVRFALADSLPDPGEIPRLTDRCLSALPALVQRPDDWWGRLRRLADLERFLVDNLFWGGMVDGTKVDAILTELTAGKRLEEGRIPVAVVACDLISGEPVVFRTGPALLALRASTALPGFVPPVVLEGQLLVDGGFVGMVPTGLVREMGADLVIAVDADPPRPMPVLRDGLEVVLRALDICSQRHKAWLLREADVVIRPAFGRPVDTLDFSQAAACVEAGVRAAREALPRVRALLRTPHATRLAWLRAVTRS